MRYYIADLHFDHNGLNERMDFRGFESTEAMNAHMINKWNNKVRPNDEVVILGDFSLSKSATRVNELLDLLNGKKGLVVGNHDKYLNMRKFDKSLFEWVENYKELHDNKRKVILSHYPVFCYNGQYRVDSAGNAHTYMLYGHVHNTFDEKLINDFIFKTRSSEREVYGYKGLMSIPCNMINCFCMFSDYEPLSLDEWIEVDNNRRNRLIKIIEETSPKL